MTKQRSEARTALAQAINERVAAIANLNDARSAASKAAEHVYDARKMLNELRETNVTPASSNAVIAGLASGSLDVLELDHPRAELRAKIEAAEQELSAWQSARKVAEEAVPGRERAVEWAQRKSRDAAIMVLRESGTAERLMTGLDELRADYLSRRVALMYIEHLASAYVVEHGDRPEDDETICRVRGALSDSARAEFAVGTRPDHHPTTKQWESALVALMADADAALPTSGDSP